MLDILQNSPEVSKHRIPMDFSPYLLSSSPPSSHFDLMECTSHLSKAHWSSFHGDDSPVRQTSSLSREKSGSDSNLNRRRRGPLKSIILSSDSEGDSSCPESPHSPGRVPKKVSFADHRGLALAQVRFVKEGPDEPPHLDPEILSSLTLGANADVTCRPPIKLCFTQPASDYLAFRDKISNNFVSLENVILKDYTVEGTIKVKNITFEKHVFVRLSLDEWATYDDIDAVYVPGPGLGYKDPYDTFSFKMDISPAFDISKTIQFAICFEENGNQHWDSNGGINYCIVSENYEADKLSSTLPAESVCSHQWNSEKSTESWSEMSLWRNIDTSTPYY